MSANVLQFLKPAELWEESYLLGNGSLGLALWGGYGRERIQLNHDTFWAGHEVESSRHVKESQLTAIQQLINKKEYLSAEKELSSLVPDRFTFPYQPMGEIEFTYESNDNVHGDGYLRTLDISKGLYNHQEVGRFNTEAFVSYPDQCAVLRFTTNGEHLYTGTIIYHPSYEEQPVKVHSEGNLIQYSIAAPYDLDGFMDKGDSEELSFTGIKGTAVLGISIEDGQFEIKDDLIDIQGVKSFCLYIYTGTNWDNPNFLIDGAMNIRTAQSKGWDKLLSKHLTDFEHLYNQFSLQIGNLKENTIYLPDDLESTPGSISKTLVQALFNYGRYLLISSSRPGCQPANLQGIWNPLIKPPWWSSYTMNINTEMNYWGAHRTGLADCSLPLFDYAMRLMENGRKTAVNLYGARGWCSHHQSDLWAQTHARGCTKNKNIPDSAEYSLWPFSGVWISLMAWDHYQYTKDREFLLNRCHPLLEGSIQFLSSFLLEMPDGSLTTNPSTSPENRFDWNGERPAVSSGSTMDLSLSLEAIHSFLDMSRLIKCDEESLEWCNVARNKIQPYRLGKMGQLQEWVDDVDREFEDHRHLSHLYSLFPGQLLMHEEYAHFREGVQKSLHGRSLESTGWSTVWKLALNARLGNVDNIPNLLQRHVKPVDPHEKEVHFVGGGSYPNLLCAHPPFQIDGNLGVVGAILELFVRQIDNKILLLPCLPPDWSEGEIIGYRLIGGGVIDIHWTNNMIDYLQIRGTEAGIWDVCVHDKRVKIEKKKNESVRLNSHLCRIEI